VVGWTNTLSIPIIQLCAPDEWIGFATGLRTLMSLGGGSVATAIFSTIYSTKATNFVPSAIADSISAFGLPPGSITALIGVVSGAMPKVDPNSIQGVNEQVLSTAIQGARLGNIRAFRYVWYASIPFGIVALVAALATRDLTPTMSMKIAQRLRNKETESQEGLEVAKAVSEAGDKVE
jgi:hypothetical protein